MTSRPAESASTGPLENALLERLRIHAKTDDCTCAADALLLIERLRGSQDLDAFQADALDTSNSLKEVAASLEVKGMEGAAAICKRGAALIREQVVSG